MKYIRSTDGRWPVAVLCRVMQVSEAGYYKYLKRPAGIDRHAPLLATIYEILKEDPENANYGVKRIFPALKINRGYGGGSYSTVLRICPRVIKQPLTQALNLPKTPEELPKNSRKL